MMDLDIEITKKFNDDIFFPMDIYTISVNLRPKPISKKMEYEDSILEEYGITREEWEQSSPRQKLFFNYNLEIGNELRWNMDKAIKFIDKVDENIIPDDEKKKILKKMEKALMAFTYPFSLQLEAK